MKLDIMRLHSYGVINEYYDTTVLRVQENDDPRFNLNLISLVYYLPDDALYCLAHHTYKGSFQVATSGNFGLVKCVDENGELLPVDIEGDRYPAYEEPEEEEYYEEYYDEDEYNR